MEHSTALADDSMLEQDQTLTFRIPTFDEKLSAADCAPLEHAITTTLQVNLGNKCNQKCTHCHMDGAPDRSEEMPKEVANRVLAVLAASSSVTTVDITGGAPELNTNFRRIVEVSTALNRHVIVRTNLTVLLDGGSEELIRFLASYQTSICASLPCYLSSNVDAQRGAGTFEKSIRALRVLNNIGYGRPDSKLRLNLVHNPTGPSLPGGQQQLESSYREYLRRSYGIEFHHLLTITNMPIGRFGTGLRSSGKADAYLQLLVDSFNQKVTGDVMCRAMVSVKWNGTLYDCDFNQALDNRHRGPADSIWKIMRFDEWEGRRIATGHHCFACTAGAGSGCGGSLEAKSC